MLTIVTNSSNGSAIFDSSQRYRYCLTRSWAEVNEPAHQVTFIMLNPSTADAEQDDPTIRACSQFAQRWGYNQLNVVNLFAYRTPHPSVLKTVTDPIGPENNRYLLEAITSAEKAILAWGNWGTTLNRAQTVLELLSRHRQKLYCLARNHSGQPSHPLYIKRNIMPHSWHE
ncbi:MAG: DUF1643 domain-containing protein [Leptolyngbyaceae cyanobacterium MAG.088]|nr:DUF1643 domain-containing protein [Leptolyngbyaceae cyanobacterium MAG.088]